MYFLIYRSEATNSMQEDSLMTLLCQSRDRNKTMDITGMLLFFDNKFIQLLEGEEKKVKLLYASICADPRHKQVATLKEGQAYKRLFPGWSMSFRTVSKKEIAEEPAYKDIYRAGTSAAMDLVSLFNLMRGKN